MRTVEMVYDEVGDAIVRFDKADAYLQLRLYAEEIREECAKTVETIAYTLDPVAEVYVRKELFATADEIRSLEIP